MIKRGQIYYADLGEDNENNIQAGVRPVLILQNDIGNDNSNTTIVAPMTTKLKNKLPTHFTFLKHLQRQTILLEQIMTINKDILMFQTGSLNDEEMEEINKKIRVSLSL